MVTGLRSTTYQDKLKELGLTTLEERRIRGDMLLTWRARSGNLGLGPNYWFTSSDRQCNVATRQSSSVGCVTKPRYNLDIRKNFYTVRAVDTWNSLPADIKQCGDINTFKEKYDNLRGR